MVKEVNLDEALEQAPEALTFEIPQVRETPDGWSSYPNMDGETWYERAMNFQKWSGHPPIPLAYMYDENWNIITAEEYAEKHKDDVPKYIEPEISEEDRINGVDVEWVENPGYKEGE